MSKSFHRRLWVATHIGQLRYQVFYLKIFLVCLACMVAILYVVTGARGPVDARRADDVIDPAVTRRVVQHFVTVDTFALAKAGSIVALGLVLICATVLLAGRRPPLTVVVAMAITLCILSTTFLLYAGRAP